MSRCLVEVWDANETEVLNYYQLEVVRRGDIRVTSQIGSSLHPVMPDQTVHVKIVLPADSEVLESGKGEPKEEEPAPAPEPEPEISLDLGEKDTSV